jgi:nucleotidyltransferase/DNA polymerase involved in DNA repair
MAEAIKRELDTELGFTFSVGLAPSKVVAKIASKWQKPSVLIVNYFLTLSQATFFILTA